MGTESDNASTKERLLEAASRVFAQKGFPGATIAEICAAAGANIAAVNYHFGDKETLYAEAWRLAFEQSLAAHPPHGGVPRTATPQERLRGVIFSLISRISDPESLVFDMVQKELANPTGLLGAVMDECLDPLRRDLESIIRELLGPQACRQKIELCHLSIRGQCFDLMIKERRRLYAGKPPNQMGPPPLEASLEEIAKHITRFSVAGIREIGRE